MVSFNFQGDDKPNHPPKPFMCPCQCILTFDVDIIARIVWYSLFTSFIPSALIVIHWQKGVGHSCPCKHSKKERKLWKWSNLGHMLEWIRNFLPGIDEMRPSTVPLAISKRWYLFRKVWSTFTDLHWALQIARLESSCIPDDGPTVKWPPQTCIFMLSGL